MQTKRKDVYTKSNCALLLAMCLESLPDDNTLGLLTSIKLLTSNQFFSLQLLDCNISKDPETL